MLQFAVREPAAVQARARLLHLVPRFTDTDHSTRPGPDGVQHLGRGGTRVENGFVAATPKLRDHQVGEIPNRRCVWHLLVRSVHARPALACPPGQRSVGPFPVQRQQRVVRVEEFEQ